MENISDTEVVVNIKLDAHQNKLLAVDLIFQGIALINCEEGEGGRLTRTNCQCLQRWWLEAASSVCDFLTSTLPSLALQILPLASAASSP